MPTQLRESRALAAEAVAGTPGRFRIQLINPGWGSSGYYAADVLEAAGTAQVFPAGTKMYLDHPSYSEAMDRPERSVRDIAGQLVEAAHWDSDAQALVAEAQVFSPYRAVLAEMKDAIGVSIRAAATVESGEAEGRQGTIITELVEGISADFVTDAGRGGRIAQVLESARSQLSEARVSDLRAQLTTALQDAYRRTNADGTTSQWVWVRDFDPAASLVYFELEGATEGLFQQGYTQNGDGTAVSLDGDPVEVAVRTEYVPVTPAGQSTTTQESEEDTMPQIEEARLRQLEADAGRVQTAEEARAAAEQRAQAAEARLQLVEARDTARPIATEVIGASESLPPSTRTRVIESLVAGVRVGENGSLDQAAFRTACEAARTQAETELAEALEAAGAGTVRGFGHTSGSDDKVTEADIDAYADAVYGPIVKGA